MAGIKINPKEIRDRIKKVYDKLTQPSKDRAMPQLILQPYKNRPRPFGNNPDR